MKSPNNTTDIPDVYYFINVDYGIRVAKEKIIKINVRKKELIAQNFDCNAYVLESKKNIGFMMKMKHIIDLTLSFIILSLFFIVLETADVLYSFYSLLELQDDAGVAPHNIVPF
jgi:hypothetical protein